MRYRITIEIDTDTNRAAVNRLANEMKDVAVTSWCNPVYVATEIAEAKQVLRERRAP